MSKSQKIRILATGGTIDKIYFDAKSEFQVGDPSINFILDEANINVAFHIESLFKKDSLELGDSDRQLIRDAVLRAEEKRILVTHGTDTMVESARYLGHIPDKVVVFTGSMEPARQRTSDAIFNIGSAFTALQLLPAGVYIAINGQVFDAQHVSKDRNLRKFIPENDQAVIRSDI